MSPIGWKQPKNIRTDNPPRADEVEGCPPHHWTIANGWQSCKKCSQREELKALTDYSYRYPPRGARKGVPGPAAGPLGPATPEEPESQA
jgi:hypothetical protein